MKTVVITVKIEVPFNNWKEVASGRFSWISSAILHMTRSKKAGNFTVRGDVLEGVEGDLGTVKYEVKNGRN